MKRGYCLSQVGVEAVKLFALLGKPEHLARTQ